MWNDLVTTFNDKVSALNEWVGKGEALLLSALPVAAFVYFVVFKLRKSSSAKRKSTDREVD